MGVSWEWVHSCSCASLGAVPLCIVLKCPHPLVVLCISVYRDLLAAPAEPVLGPAFPSLDPLNPSMEKEEPRGQRPSSQACQLGLKLLRGPVAPPPPRPSWAPAFPGAQRGCPTEEPQEATGTGAGALFGLGAWLGFSGGRGPARPQ